MKKILCLLITVFLTVSCLNVSAEENPIVMICDEYNVYIKTDAVFAALEGSINYNTELMDFAGIEFTDSLKVLNKSDDSVRIRSGRIDFLILAETGGHSGKWARLSFSPRTESPAECAFTLTSGSFAVTVYAERQHCSEATVYSYTNQTKGDVNLDCTVDIRDIICMKKYLSGMEVSSLFSTVNADCDNDRSFTSCDIVLLRKFLLGVIDL